MPDFAAIEDARLDCLGAIPQGISALRSIQTELGFTGLRIESMAGETLVGKNRKNVAIKLYAC
jgi:hypothetical protein